MEEQAKQALADLLERAVDGVDSAVAFSQAQIPDVVEQLLLWNMTISAIGFVFGILLLLAIPLSLRWVYKSWDKVEEVHAEEPVLGISIFGSFAALAIGLIFVFVNLDWLQIWIAPKLYLLEYAADLVK